MAEFEYEGFTGYGHMELGASFWTTREVGNDDHPLVLALTVGSSEFTICLRALARAARTCKRFFAIVQRRLTQSKALRNKWERRFADCFIAYSVYRLQPIRYTGRASVTVPLDGMSGNALGLAPLDEGNFQPADGLTYAFSGALLHFRAPRSFTMVLRFSEYFIYSRSYTPNDFEWRPEGPGAAPNTVIITPVGHPEGAQAQDAARGSWTVDLRLPMSYNPVVIGDDFVTPNRLYICIGPTGYVTEQATLDIPFVIANIGHITINMRTVPTARYDWAQYASMLNSRITEYARFYPIICKLEDHRPATTDDLAREQRGFLAEYMRITHGIGLDYGDISDSGEDDN